MEQSAFNLLFPVLPKYRYIFCCCCCPGFYRYEADVERLEIFHALLPPLLSPTPTDRCSSRLYFFKYNIRLLLIIRRRRRSISRCVSSNGLSAAYPWHVLYVLLTSLDNALLHVPLSLPCASTGDCTNNSHKEQAFAMADVERRRRSRGGVPWRNNKREAVLFLSFVILRPPSNRYFLPCGETAKVLLRVVQPASFNIKFKSGLWRSAVLVKEGPFKSGRCVKTNFGSPAAPLTYLGREYALVQTTVVREYCCFLSFLWLLSSHTQRFHSPSSWTARTLRECS